MASVFELDSDRGVPIMVRQCIGRQLKRGGDHVIYMSPTSALFARRCSIDGDIYYRVGLRDPWPKSRLSRLAFLVMFPLICFQLWLILYRERIQIVNVHYFEPLWIYFIFLRRFMSFRLVVNHWAVDVEGLCRLPQWLPFIDRIVFCTDGHRMQYLSKESPFYAKSVVIRPAIDGETIVAKVKKYSPKDHIVCVAELRHEKAHEVLIQAFHLISDDFPEITLELVGDGPRREYLQSLAKELGLLGKVNFHGHIPRERALEYIKNARVFCLPSRSEPSGGVLMEAMALGTPVVASRGKGGIPEVVRDGIDGLLVAPDCPEELSDALRRMLVDKQLRASFIRSSLERVRETFALSRIARDFRNMYVSCGLENESKS